MTKLDKIIKRELEAVNKLNEDKKFDAINSNNLLLNKQCIYNENE